MREIKLLIVHRNWRKIFSIGRKIVAFYKIKFTKGIKNNFW